MKHKSLLIVMACMLAFALPARAQLKLGYANIDLILAYMPETETLRQSLQTYQSQLSKQLEAKENEYKSKMQEVEVDASNGYTNEQLRDKYGELIAKLEKEYTDLNNDSERRFATKRAELMEPIMEKLQQKIDEVAKEENITYILNATDGSGGSIVLYAPEDRNITEKVMKKLGIALPEAEKTSEN